MTNTVKKIALPFLTTLLIVGVFTVPHPASAGVLGDVVATIIDPFGVGAAAADAVGLNTNTITEGIKAALGIAVSYFTLSVGYFFSMVVAKLTEVMGLLIDLGISYNVQVATNPGVVLGWKVFRDVANLGFVIGILFMAFATMIRSERYGAKKLLGTFIIVALLINYSLVIPGVVLDASHVFSTFFISKATSAGGDLSASMMAILTPQKLIDPAQIPGLAAGAAGQDLAATFMLVVDLALVVIFGIIILFTLGAMAFMITLRFFMILFLLVIAPVAWLSLIFPALANQWSRWWNSFFRWTFFLPSATFFIYLAVKVMETARATTDGQSEQFAAILNSNGRFDGFFSTILATGLLIGGLIVSEKFGITGATTAIGMVKGMRDRTLGAMKGAAVGTGAYIGTRPTKAVARGLANVLNTRILRGIPGAKGAVARLSAAGTRKEEVAQYQKDYLASLTDAQMETVYKTAPVGPVAKAALLAEAVKRRKVHLLTAHMTNPVEKAGRLQEFMSAAQATNPGVELKDIESVKTIIEASPELVPSLLKPEFDKQKNRLQTPEEQIAAVVAKARSEKTSEWSRDAFSNPVVARELTKAQIGNVYSKGSSEQIRTLEQTVKDMAGDPLLKIYDQISVAEEKLAQAKRLGNRSEERKLKEDLRKLAVDEENLLANSDEQTQKAYYQWGLMKQQVGGGFVPKKPLPPVTAKLAPDEEGDDAGGTTPPPPVPPPVPPPIPPAKPGADERAEEVKQRGEQELRRQEQEQANLRRQTQQDIASGKEIVIGRSGEYTDISDAVKELKRRGLADEEGRVVYPKVRVFVNSKDIIRDGRVVRKGRGLEEQFLEGTEAAGEDTTPPAPPTPVPPTPPTPPVPPPQPQKQNPPSFDRTAEEQAVIDSAREEMGRRRVEETRQQLETEKKITEERRKQAEVAEKERAAEAESLTTEIKKRGEAVAESARLERERIEKGISAAEAASAAKAKAEKTVTVEQRRQAEIAERQREADEALGKALTRKRAGINEATAEFKKSVTPPAPSPRPITPPPPSKTVEIKPPVRPTTTPRPQIPSAPIEEKPRGAPGAGPDIEGAGTSGLGELNR